MDSTNDPSTTSTSTTNPASTTKPIKMKKPKKDKEKQQKRNAFMSFLQAPTQSMTQSILLEAEKKNASDNEETYQQFVQDTNQCYICHEKLDPVKKKKCEFCTMECCNNHLRKRRRKNKKMQRICDWCEDKTLFQNYMKLELKAEEALATQQQIVMLKHQGFTEEVEKQREKRNQLIFKAQGIKTKQQQQVQSLKKQQQDLVYKQRSLQKDQLELKQLLMMTQRLSHSMKDNFEEDHKILMIENEKLAKDIANLDKRRQQIQKAIEKREKEIESAYEQWEKKQYLRNIEIQNAQAAAAKKKDCVIY